MKKSNTCKISVSLQTARTGATPVSAAPHRDRDLLYVKEN